MMNRISFVFLLSLAFAFFACGGGSEPTPPPPDKGTQRTVLAYWVADNGRTDLSSYAISDFNEMLVGMEQVDVTKNNLIVYCETRTDYPHLIHVTKDAQGLVVADTLKTYTEQNPLNVGVMSSIMQYVFEEYPAESYGLIFASHADGWIPATVSATRHMGDYRNTQMNVTDFRKVLEGLPHLDFILFDACYMQSIEVAYELRNCTDYVIASPTEIPGPGAPYQAVIPLVFANKADVAVDIAQGYYEYYGAADGSLITTATYINGNRTYTWPYGVSVSVLATSTLGNLAAKTKAVLTKYLASEEYVDASSLFYYGRNESSTCYYYDMEKLIEQITGANADYSEWLSLFNAAQPYFKTTVTNCVNRRNSNWTSMDGASGVYMYVPQSRSLSLNTFYSTYDWYSDGGWGSLGW
ncbi:hypothetical protein D0T50_00840 [Bacteroides sp. 214]|uniref:clostripain-related cysteine peptidase n=1 Tax=Bacteroides sp. 214 TaxID=2302935 RepID=UPI0013D2B3A9|nr:clostripain-related cysteine peptidase [Bacteroides sp. 214]NDW11434.1 hypothetical protein [Bacteroides sp. 214]